MDDHTMRAILGAIRTIAFVGLSPKGDRPSHQVASYLQEQGYRIIPVRPGVSEILGERAYASLKDIPTELQIDAVDVFRKAAEVPPIAEQAAARGAKVLWLQEGIIHEAAAERARKAGLMVVMDRCMLKEHRRLMT